MSIEPIILQEVADSTNAVVVFFISLLIGALGIHIGARILIDRDVGYGRAIVAALIGAIVWAIISFFFGWLPLVGPLLALLAWIGVINATYPGGWISAAGIGIIAWIAVEVILYVLYVVGLIELSALGIPGA